MASESRHILTDLDNRIEAQQLGESESCFILSDEMRIALLTWIGNTSRNDRIQGGATQRQAILIERFYSLLET